LKIGEKTFGVHTMSNNGLCHLVLLKNVIAMVLKVRGACKEVYSPNPT
jgi:hypothetical protein